jgi:diguanylate cyclase (GGDEF)-like protein/PAS domain S-box-containing protein
VIDLDGQVVSANPAVRTVFGYGPEELVGGGIGQLVPEDLKDELAHVMRTVVGGGTPLAFTTRRRRKDGTIIDISISLSEVRDAQGAVIGISGISRDVTAESRTRVLLEASERRLRTRFEQSGMPQAILDLSGRILSANDALCRLLQRDRQELEGQPSQAFRHAGDPGGEAQITDVAVGLSDAETWERTFSLADGTEVPVLVQACLLRDPDGTPYAVECFMQDISPLHQTEQSLRESEARYRAIAETAQEGIWTISRDGRTVYANHKLAEILGVSLETVHTTPPQELFGPGDDVAHVVERLQRREQHQAEQYELGYPHPDGDPRVLRLSVSPITNETGITSWLVMVTDISDARRAEEELRRRALYDDLTGLPNRSLLTDRLDRAVVSARQDGDTPIAVLFVDLDQFKLVNDSWGHEVGDRLVVAVARRLSAAARISDTVSRFGGDEFVIIREGADEADAEKLAAELMEALAAPFDLTEQRSYVTASIGIAVSPPSPGGDLLRFAESAMYDAKARGRGRIHVFDIASADQTTGQLALSNDLREALARDELELYYQPLVELTTGRVLGVEALARWSHPTRGAVSPMQFVAVAEATGQASSLDRWALSRACRDLRQLRAATYPGLRVSVNLSATHFADADLEVTLLSTLHSFGLECSDIELEITESAIMANPDYARALLERLRAQGMSIAIDDFGTGYSSLGYLRRLPATTVKIDRSFVHEITEDPNARAIVASIIDLCKTMGLTTIAEGIETVEQLDLLTELGCTAGQGFLWSRALPLERFAQRIGALPDGCFDV